MKIMNEEINTCENDVPRNIILRGELIIAKDYEKRGCIDGRGRSLHAQSLC